MTKQHVFAGIVLLGKPGVLAHPCRECVMLLSVDGYLRILHFVLFSPLDIFSCGMREMLLQQNGDAG
eukprot:3780267-Ditylum_brightwellii.AAC.1